MAKKVIVTCPTCGQSIIPWSKFKNWLSDRLEKDAIPLVTCGEGVSVYTIGTGPEGRRVEVSLA